MSKVPRVSHRSKVADHRATAVCEFMHVELTEENSAGGTEAADDFGIVNGNAILKQTAACGRTHARGIHQILECNRDAVKGAAPPALLDLLLGTPGFDQSGLRTHGNKRIQLRIESFDAAQTRPRQLNR